MNYITPREALYAGIVLTISIVSFVLFLNQLVSVRITKSSHSLTLLLILGLYSICAFCDAGTWYFSSQADSYIFRICIILDYELFVLVAALHHAYLVEDLTAHIPLPGLYKYIGYGIAAVSGIFWALSMQYSFFYTIEDNTYRYGPHILFAQLPLLTIFAVDIIILLLHHNQMKSYEVNIYLIYLIVTLGGAAIEYIYETPTLYIGYLIVMIVVYLQIDIKKTSTIIEQQTRIEDEQALLSLVQIKPHFIYNCMNVIQTLCTTNPSLAQKATLHFSSFMRDYVDALDNVAMIPLEDELHMVNHYVYLSQLRYGKNRIRYECKLEEEDFFIPALSVEPFIENAIKYGLAADDAPLGTVLLHTYSTEANYVIEISDNGVGYEPNSTNYENNSKSHTGIQNVKKRVKHLCNGQIETKSEIGVGTTVTITIPKKKN